MKLSPSPWRIAINVLKALNSSLAFDRFRLNILDLGEVAVFHSRQ